MRMCVRRMCVRRLPLRRATPTRDLSLPCWHIPRRLARYAPPSPHPTPPHTHPTHTRQHPHPHLPGNPPTRCSLPLHAPPRRPDLIRLPLKLLADFGVGLDRVAEYPRVFGHDPVTYLGPRLAYLKAYSPGRLQASRACGGPTPRRAARGAGQAPRRCGVGGAGSRARLTRRCPAAACLPCARAAAPRGGPCTVAAPPRGPVAVPRRACRQAAVPPGHAVVPL